MINTRTLLTTAIAGLCFTATTHAAGQVDVQVWTIQATRTNDEISKELKPLAKSLKKAFKFTGYKLLKTETKAVNNNQKPAIWQLPQPYRLEITLKEVTGDKIRMELLVTRQEKEKEKVQKVLRTTIALQPGKFQLFGGWSVAEGDILILAVSCKPQP